jgi:hypothetical protein
VLFPWYQELLDGELYEWDISDPLQVICDKFRIELAADEGKKGQAIL